MITFLPNKDITTVKCGVIAHCVNCQGVMGSGVAFHIKNKWPIVFNQYINFINDMKRTNHVKTTSDLLGRINIVNVSHDIDVINIFGQDGYGVDKVWGDITALTIGLHSCLQYISSLNETQVKYYALFLPKIGSKRAGLDWNTEVLPVIERLAIIYSDIDIVICEFEG